MKINFTRHNLKKIENIFSEISFKVRYEKGAFKSGYCIVEKSNIIVVNKFFDIEGRISCLIDILRVLDTDFDGLSSNSRKLLTALRKDIVEVE